MSNVDDLKQLMLEHLRHQRAALGHKVAGLSERELRLPRTPTGTNLLGILKHCANVEFGYFGPTFGRMIEDPRGLLEPDDFAADPQADWYAPAEQPAAGVIDLYRRVQAFADATIEDLDLDSPGRVGWWPSEHADVTLGQILVYVTMDIARHAGHADILREQVDGAVGWWGPGDNVPQGYDWAGYVARLTAIAERFGGL